MSLREEIYSKLGTVVASATDVDSLALAAGALAKLNEANDSDISYDKYTIGTAGVKGFGVGTISDQDALNAGMTKMAGTDNPLSDNFGNFLDSTGSVMVWVPKFYFKWATGNVLSISAMPASGYAVHRAFIDGGVEKSGFFIDKYGCGNVNGIFTSRAGLDPVSTNSVHNPIASINGCSASGNYYKTAYLAVKSRGTNYHLPSLFQYNALALLAFAHSQASTSVSVCAFKDVAPYLPKGCNNNALKDVNDTSVVFHPSGYSNCALTGSGAPFAKTTHNGQNSGVADINGNMWEVASGLTKSQQTDGNFLILKESVSLKSFTTATDTTTATATDAYYTGNYDTISLADLIPSAEAGIQYFGNGANDVFSFSETRTADAYKRACAGIPNATGVSGSGTTAFGNDSNWRYWRTHLTPIVGGNWVSSSDAGAFTLILGYVATGSSDSVGARASRYV